MSALIGLIGAGVPAIATNGFGLIGGGGAGAVITTSTSTSSRTTDSLTEAIRPTSATGATTEPAAEIVFTVSDQLTDDIDEEIITISLEGQNVASLHATADHPVVTESVIATTAGNYSYVVDGQFWWVDEYGEVQGDVATGRGSVYIDHGTRLDVYLHWANDGSAELSLQRAGS